MTSTAEIHLPWPASVQTSFSMAFGPREHSKKHRVSPLRSDPADEGELVRAAANGNARAFAALVDRYDQSLRALTYTILDSADLLDDVLQESYIKAFRSLPRFEQNSSFKTWIYRIVHNTAIDEIRKRRPAVPLYDDDDDDLARRIPQPGPSDYEQLHHRLDINAAMARLPESQRVTVLLVDGQGFDYKAAADMLQIPIGTVSTRVNKGRATLRMYLAVSEEE